MSTPELPQKPVGAGPPGSRLTTWLIGLIIATVLAIPALCACGAVGTAFWTWLTPSPPIDVQTSPPPEARPRPASKPHPPEHALRLGPKSQPPEEVPLPEPRSRDVIPEGKAQYGKRALFTLEPFTSDKAIMPANTRVNFGAIGKERKSSAATTLLQFYPDRDPQLHNDNSFVTGFTISTNVPSPTTGLVSFHVLGVGAQTTIEVSIDKSSVWTYQGGPEESAASPLVPIAGKQDEAKTLDLSLTVGGGDRDAISGIQTFSVYEEPKGR